MLALAIIAAVFGLVVGSRAKLLGLALSTALMGAVSFVPQFHVSDPSPSRYVMGFVVAVVVHQLAALLAMLIRYLTLRAPVRPVGASNYSHGIKQSQARARH